MVCAVIFETTGAVTVGARTADTIKNGIIPIESFRNNPGVQMLAFTCALAGASTWVMWCTRHSTHVSSTYSLISSVAGVGVAVAGASNVNWGWNGGQGMGAIFSGLIMAPVIAGCFGATIFSLIKVIVHMRQNPVPWAVYTSPFFFLVAGTICTLSIIYKGSPNLGLSDKPPGWIAGVCLGAGGALALLAAIFFVPFVYTRVIKQDYTVKYWMIIYGPALLNRGPPPDDAQRALVPNYAVVQEDDSLSAETDMSSDRDGSESDEKLRKRKLSGDPGAHEQDLVASEVKAADQQYTYKQLMAQGRERLHAKLRQGRGPLGWAMRFLHENPWGPGEAYELKNIKIFFKRLPAMIVVAALYGINYDIHAAQTGIAGTPEGERMAKVYAHAHKYPNESEHCYSYIQVITACTASFAHGANDVGNAVAPWAVIYGAWSTGDPAQSEAAVPLWQIAVLALTICFGLCTYGFNIMKVMGNKITYHSPSRGTLFIPETNGMVR